MIQLRVEPTVAFFPPRIDSWNGTKTSCGVVSKIRFRLVFPHTQHQISDRNHFLWRICLELFFFFTLLRVGCNSYAMMVVIFRNSITFLNWSVVTEQNRMECQWPRGM